MKKKIIHFLNECPTQLITDAKRLLSSQHVEIVIAEEDICRLTFQNKNAICEASAIISKSIVEDVQCSCLDFKRHLFCVHLCALLLSMQNEKSKSKKQTSPNRNISIKQLLDEVNADELKIFLQQHAKSDLKLRHFLRTQFAHKLGDRNPDKYKNIVKEAIRISSNQGNIPTLSALKFFLKTTNHLLGQAEDFFSMQNFRECHDILSALLSYGFISLRSKPLIRQKLHPSLMHTIQLSRRMLEKPIGPQIKDAMWEDAAEFFELKLPLEPLINNTLLLMENLAYDRKRNRVFRQLLIEKINDTEDGRSAIEYLYFSIPFWHKNKRVFPGELLARQSFFVLNSLAKRFIKTNDVNYADSTISVLEDRTKDKHELKLLYQTKLEIALKKKDKGIISTTAECVAHSHRTNEIF